MEKLILKQIEKLLQNAMKNVAMKDDLKDLATKSNLEKMEASLKEYIDETRNDLMESVEEHKVDKRDFRQLERRVDKIEKQLQAA